MAKRARKATRKKVIVKKAINGGKIGKKAFKPLTRTSSGATRTIGSLSFLFGVAIAIITGLVLIAIGQSLENAFLVEVGAWEIIFGALLGKPIIRLLQRRGLQDFFCDGCSQWFPLYGRWRCSLCQGITIRHCFQKCPSEDCQQVGFSSINCPHCQLNHNL